MILMPPPVHLPGRCGWSCCWHNVGWRGGAAADNVVSGQVSGLSLHQHLGMATITVGIDTSRVYNRCTHTTHNSYSIYTVERRWLNTHWIMNLSQELHDIVLIMI